MSSKNNKKKNGNQTDFTVEGRIERIRSRAREIWESCGCPHGQDQEHWLQAESEIDKLTS
jgi:Protein of unknown function (DUF2934)